MYSNLTNDFYTTLRNYLIIAFALFLAFQQIAMAQEAKSSFIFPLKNNKYLIFKGLFRSDYQDLGGCKG